MRDLGASVTGCAVATAFGTGVSANVDALFRGESAFSAPGHFDAKGRLLGIDHELDGGSGSRAERLLEKLRSGMDFEIPAGTSLFVATTVGAIDLLERGEELDTSLEFLHLAERIFGVKNGVLVSAACASGQCAAGLALRQLAAGACRHALVVGGDIASEFCTAGFASLGALSPTLCRPYDADRDGLTLGEGAGALLLSRETGGFGRLVDAGENCDAGHITAPDLTGAQLRRLVEKLVRDREIGGIVGHGTGTRYNDQAEVAALSGAFGAKVPPLVSIKGNYGHTLGATGVLQLILGIEFSRRGELPPQARLRRAMDGATASTASSKLAARSLLSVNVGFGGLNSAVVLEAS